MITDFSSGDRLAFTASTGVAGGEIEVLTSWVSYGSALAAAQGVLLSGISNIVSSHDGTANQYLFLDTNDDNVLDAVIQLKTATAISLSGSDFIT